MYKQFAILGPESLRASEASECAAEQDQFWAYHDRVFEDQITNQSPLNDDTLKGIAAQIGLDTEAFNQCLTSNKFTDLIQQESFALQSLGVRGTPGFLINGVYMVGAQPYEAFKQVIDEQLVSLEVSSP